MSPFSSLRGLPRVYWFLWAGQLINRVGGFVVPFLAIYLKQERHFSDAQAAFVVALYGVGALLAGLTGGLLADTLGRRATLLGGLVAAAGCMVALGFARDVRLIALLTLLIGLTTDTYRPAVSAIIADLLPPQDRLRAYANLYWASNLGFAVATVVAGHVAMHGYLALFLADGATTLGFAAVAWFKIPETHRPAQPREALSAARAWGDLTLAFRDPTFVSFLGVTFPLALIFFQFQLALPAEMTAHGATAAQFGNSMAINGVLIVVLQPFVIERIRRFRRSRVMAVANLLVGLGFGLNAFFRVPWQYGLGIAIWTLGELTSAPVSSSVVADLAPPEGRGRYQGAFFMTWAMASVVAPLLGGPGRAWLGSGFWLLCLGGSGLIALGHLAIAGQRRARLAAIRGEPTVALD